MSLSNQIHYKSEASDCVAEIHPSVTANKFHVVFGDKNCRLEIAQGCHFHNLQLYFRSDNTHVYIGRDTLCRSTFWAKLSGKKSSITVGENCLFDSVKLRTSDSHPIVDLETGDVINSAENIKIGNHVWIAEDVLILKGSNVGSGSAIGARAM